MNVAIKSRFNHVLDAAKDTRMIRAMPLAFDAKRSLSAKFFYSLPPIHIASVYISF